MTLPKSLRSYDNEKTIFDGAFENGGRARVICKSLGQAVNIRARLHRFRALDRDSNAEIYPADHPMHGASIYDNLLVRLDNGGGKYTLIIEPREVGGYTVEYGPVGGPSIPGDGNIS
jgi:hypothetical protein